MNDRGQSLEGGARGDGGMKQKIWGPTLQVTVEDECAQSSQSLPVGAYSVFCTLN